MTPGLVWGMNLKCPWITFGVKNPCGMTFPEHFLRLAGFGPMTHPNLRVGNDTWTSLGDEFEVPVDHFWGQKPLRNDFSRVFSESGFICGMVMTLGLVWGINLKCPLITFGVKNPCGMTFPEHFLQGLYRIILASFIHPVLSG